MKNSTTWKMKDDNANLTSGNTKYTHTLDYRLIYSVVFGVSLIACCTRSFFNYFFSSSDAEKFPSALSEARSMADSAVPYVYQH